MLQAFDTPIPFSTVGRRQVSNVPAQALILLNDPFVHDLAAKWASRVLNKQQAAPDRIRGMFVAAFGRDPMPQETATCLEFLASQSKALAVGVDDPKAWQDLAHMLFNAKEFIYLN